MQTLNEIRQLLSDAGLEPRKRFGQNFLYDQNLLAKLLELAEIDSGQTVLEVGPGTGSLTEELLARAKRVVAVEIDRDLCRLLGDRLGGDEKLTLLCGDVLAGKHAMCPEVLDALGTSAVLVANLPYNIATPLVAICLEGTYRAQANPAQAGLCRFDRLTFTVQHEVADCLAAKPGSKDYGPVSILAALLGRAQLGPTIPPSAFWPRPGVVSRIVRLDFDIEAAGKLRDIDMLEKVIRLAFAQRRKQIHSAARRKGAGIDLAVFDDALAAAGIERSVRPEQVSPEQYLLLANFLAESPPA